MTATSQPPSKLDKFTTAMQHIYSFPKPSQSSEIPASSWTPPPMSEGHHGRYLWTDGFGVLNFLTLYRSTANNPHYLTLAKQLIHTVHNILGRTRDLSSRLPGATDSCPLAGGLRIGKESATGADADGQYHHYLTVWMFALNRMSVASGEKWYNDQAISLANAIHPKFVYDRDSARPRMVWKMSIDLERPLVRSEGNLDPIDGYVTFRLLQERDGEGSQVLQAEIEDYRKILETKWRGYRSDDPLDLGMTLWTAHWFAGEEEWATGLTERAKRDLTLLYDQERYFDDVPTRARLAFREFGTCLGIRTAMTDGAEWEARAEKIIQIWEIEGLVPSPGEKSKPGRNAMDKLLPITLVMYATALIPGAFDSKTIRSTATLSNRRKMQSMLWRNAWDFWNDVFGQRRAFRSIKQFASQGQSSAKTFSLNDDSTAVVTESCENSGHHVCFGEGTG